MENRLGGFGRLARLAGAGMSFTCAVMAPLPPAARVAAFGTLGAYLLVSALVGTCWLERLIGRGSVRDDRR